MYAEAKLSPREIQICDSLLRGMTMQEIAAENYRTVKTVFTWKYRAFSKLGIKSVADLFLLRITHNLEHPPIMPSFLALEGYQNALQDLLQ